jgi:hypothetical protein
VVEAGKAPTVKDTDNRLRGDRMAESDPNTSPLVKELRAELTRLFPDTDFKVTQTTPTAAHVQWVDGPDSTTAAQARPAGLAVTAYRGASPQTIALAATVRHLDGRPNYPTDREIFRAIDADVHPDVQEFSRLILPMVQHEWDSPFAGMGRERGAQRISRTLAQVGESVAHAAGLDYAHLKTLV